MQGPQGVQRHGRVGGRGLPAQFGFDVAEPRQHAEVAGLAGTQVALDEPDAPRAVLERQPVQRLADQQLCAAGVGAQRHPGAGHRQRRLREQHGLAGPAGRHRDLARPLHGLFDTAAQAERVHRLQLPGQPTRRRQLGATRQFDRPGIPLGSGEQVTVGDEPGSLVGAVTGRLREGCRAGQRQRGVEHRILVQHVRFEPAEGATCVQAVLIGEPGDERPALIERTDRVAAAVQRDHQARGQGLGLGKLPGPPAQVGDRTGVIAGGQFEFGQLGEQFGSAALEVAAHHRDRLDAFDALEGHPAPLEQPIAQRGGSRRRVTPVDLAAATQGGFEA
ncbi:MAG: hypothetical protein R2742_06055 [Micropruina glycogenica]